MTDKTKSIIAVIALVLAIAFGITSSHLGNSRQYQLEISIGKAELKGVIKKLYVDRENHGILTVVFIDSKKFMFPLDSKDYFKQLNINIGDSLYKPINTYKFYIFGKRDTVVTIE